MMARSGKDGWTEEDLNTLRREWRAGAMVMDMAAQLGRSEIAVRRAAVRLGLTRDPDATASRKVDHSTPRILQMWADGVPVEMIAAKVGKTARAVQLVAAYHKVRRPAWYLSAVRGKASAEQVAA
jgi:hypothetical protein